MEKPFIGQIKLFPYNFSPADWLVCAGQHMSVEANRTLFELLGARFGGDGRTTFALPNLQGAEPQPGTRYCIALKGMRPSRG